MAGPLRTLLFANARASRPWGNKRSNSNKQRVVGGALRAQLSSHRRSQPAAAGGVGVRKRMVPLIKLVHPDLFAQYPPDVAKTNSKSLKDLNTLIDAAEALEAAAAGLTNGNDSGNNNASSASPPSVDPLYTLTFFHHTTTSSQDARGHIAAEDVSSGGGDGGGGRGGWGGRGGGGGGGGDGEGEGRGVSSSRIADGATQGEHALNNASVQSGLEEPGKRGRGRGGAGGGEGGGRGEEDMESADSLVELRAELRFPPALSADPSGSLRGQLRRQLDGLLRRVPGFDGEGRGGAASSSSSSGGGGKRGGEEMAMGEGVRLAEGETEEEFYGEEAYRGMFREARRRRGPPRDGIRMERASSRNADDSAESGPGMTSEKLRNMTIEHAGNNHHVNPWDSGFGAGFFGGGLNGGGGGRGRGGRAEEAAQAKSRLVDDLLRSGRVQFAGVPLSREASALQRLHRVLVKYFDHLELHDRGLWSTVILVLRAKCDTYDVRVTPSGPVLAVPETFTEKNLVRFLSEVLLSYS